MQYTQKFPNNASKFAMQDMVFTFTLVLMCICGVLGRGKSPEDILQKTPTINVTIKITFFFVVLWFTFSYSAPAILLRDSRRMLSRTCATRFIIATHRMSKVASIIIIANVHVCVCAVCVPDTLHSDSDWVV